MAQKENEENVKFLMDTFINPIVELIEKESFLIPQGAISFKILRTIFDGKTSRILSGAAGAHCQLCSASYTYLKYLDLVRTGFPINRTISSAKEIFTTVDTDEFFFLPSQQRFGLTHKPISEIDIIPASPLHTYTCVFR